MPPMVSSMVRWTARLITMLVAGVFLAFVLGEPAGSLRAIHLRDWVGLALLFGAIATMLLAWRQELPFALISLFALGAFAAVVHMTRYDVLVVAAIPNLLYLLDWKLRHAHGTPIAKLS
jgi:uncharacterized membrane protein YoaT (DUF817 family)